MAASGRAHGGLPLRAYVRVRPSPLEASRNAKRKSIDKGRSEEESKFSASGAEVAHDLLMPAEPVYPALTPSKASSAVFLASGERYEFDGVFPQQSTQDDVWESVGRPCVDQVWSGTFFVHAFMGQSRGGRGCSYTRGRRVFAARGNDRLGPLGHTLWFTVQSGVLL